MSGAVVAGIVLEILKNGFGLYVTSFPTYQTIYGALATIPIFLIWMYLLWNVVLWGAEMAAALPEWRAGIGRDQGAQRKPSSAIAAATSLLALLLAAHRVGGGLRWRHLLRASGQPAGPLMAAAEALREHRYIELSESNAWFLARDLDKVTLADLHRDLGLSLADAGGQVSHTAWGGKLADTLRTAENAGYEAMNMSLESLLAEENEQVAHLVVGGRGAEDDEDDEIGEPRSYKNRLLALLGLAWLIGR
jgi:membrane protein